MTIALGDASMISSRSWSSLDQCAVTISDDFWAPRRERIRLSMLRQQERQLRAPGQQFDALKLTWRPGDPHEPKIMWESDIAKWIEAASYCLVHAPDPELEASVEEAITLLAGAQQPDGYLNVYFTVVKPGQRFSDLRDACELYCAGHLIEAAVAHHAATGRSSLLDVVIRYADLIDVEFGPGGSCEGGFGGQGEIELALIKLARVTGQRRYVDCALRMVCARDTAPLYFGCEQAKPRNVSDVDGLLAQRPQQAQLRRQYNQSHLPVVEQVDIIGHPVRAMYLYAAVTELAAEKDAPHAADLAAACDRVWASLTQRRLEITGEVRARSDPEGFGDDYELPEARGHAEACATIALVAWALRMANTRRDASFMEVLERALYNGVLSDASAEGASCFSGNPPGIERSEQLGDLVDLACCPPDYARLIGSLEQYAYARGIDEAVVHLYISGTAEFDLSEGSIVLQVNSEQPLYGEVIIEVLASTLDVAALVLRIPDWATSAQLCVNGEPLDLAIASKGGYARVHRPWRPGDVLELRLEMLPERVWAHPAIAGCAHKVALQCGPFVFCFEELDHDAPLAALSLPRDAVLAVREDIGSGLVTILSDGWKPSRAHDRSPSLYRNRAPLLEPQPLRAVPYFFRAARGQSDMAVWIHEGPAQGGGPPSQCDHSP